MKRIVVFSGAGVSAESGLTTFRDAGGLWEQYDIQEVATPEAWAANPALVLEFYNSRRDQVMAAQPNDAHRAIAQLEEKFEVIIITQNIDDLHERAGSSNVLHLHGEITKAKSVTGNPQLYDVTNPLKMGDRAEDGEQLRPHVVWFGEPVPEFDNARKIMETADIVFIIGTSLNVYPAAGLIFHAPKKAEMYLVDPAEVSNPGIPDLRVIRDLASKAIPTLVDQLLETVKV